LGFPEKLGGAPEGTWRGYDNKSFLGPPYIPLSILQLTGGKCYDVSRLIPGSIYAPLGLSVVHDKQFFGPPYIPLYLLQLTGGACYIVSRLILGSTYASLSLSVVHVN
jgi:hypothetical protein